jgi:hypothetical protein
VAPVNETDMVLLPEGLKALKRVAKCSGLRTGRLGLANNGVCGPAIGANLRCLGPTLSANEPTLVCEGLAHRSVGQHALRIR